MMMHPAKAVACPTCTAPANRDCSFIDGALHNGWVHQTRQQAFDESMGADRLQERQS